VCERNGKELTLTWSSFKVPLRHWHYNTFVVPPQKEVAQRALSGAMATFALDEDGDVVSVQLLGRTFRRGK
jgi:hypothetical protein